MAMTQCRLVKSRVGDRTMIAARTRLLHAARRRTIAAALLAVALGAALPAAPVAAQELLTLRWADLVPAAAPKGSPREFFSGRAPIDPLNPTHEQSVPEGRWLAGGKSVTGQQGPTPVVEALNGKRVQLGGYVVPLDFDATTVKEFLLVPFVGACIHVPPPPPNQIVFVSAPKGIKIGGMFAPVTVTGRMVTQASFTGLADTGYTLEAERVDARKE